MLIIKFFLSYYVDALYDTAIVNKIFDFEIENRVFEGCDNLTHIRIPHNVKEIIPEQSYKAHTDWCWLKDQLSWPEWFRNLVVDRSAWGAFSIYAHARLSDGKSKISYGSKAKAEKVAFDMSKKYGYPFITYKCLFCDGWHISKTIGKNAQGKTTE